MGRQDGRVLTGSAIPLSRHREPRAVRADWFELGVLGVFAAVSMWLIALNLWYAARQHVVWTGIDGFYPVDQLQYLAWISDAARHVLVSDLFTGRATPHDYLQPMVAISGGLAAAGLAPWLALLVWKPVAILALFFAVRAYCHRLLPTRAQRNMALLLALFAASFNVVDNEWIPFLSWGYPFDLLSLAALVGALIAYEASRTRGSLSPAAPALGALAAWLHPWQGELLIVLIIGSDIVWSFTSDAHARIERRRHLALTVATVLATALPLAYYAALGKFDPVWRAGQAASQLSWGLGEVGLPLLPLVVAALPGYLRRPSGFLDVTLRAWPLAALLVWSVNQTSLGAWSLYAWVGITVPLGVLAVQGASVWRLSRIPHHRWVAALAVAALTIPGSYTMLSDAPGIVWPNRSNQNLITHSESRAMAYLAADRLPGSVLSPYPLGDAVPAETGRRTFVGDNRWSVQYRGRNWHTWRLVDGRLRATDARAFVRHTGARFILAPCGSRNLDRALGPMLASVHGFGCLKLYQVRLSPTRA
jgi:hypothetical protein